MIKTVIEKDMFYVAKAETFALALQMRKKAAEAENVMWKLLRKFRQKGFTFRRLRPHFTPGEGE
jgi:very-short-patch-repair endonuclease